MIIEWLYDKRGEPYAFIKGRYIYEYSTMRLIGYFDIRMQFFYGWDNNNLVGFLKGGVLYSYNTLQIILKFRGVYTTSFKPFRPFKPFKPYRPLTPYKPYKPYKPYHVYQNRHVNWIDSSPSICFKGGI